MTNKDIIAQYVDTGLELPEYQVTQLPGWAAKSYIRKRLIAANLDDGFLQGYETTLLNPEQSEQYFSKYFKLYVDDMNFPNPTVQNQIKKDLKYFPDKYQSTYVDTQIAMDNALDEKVFFQLTTENKIKFLDWNVKRGLKKNSMSDIFYHNKMFEELKVYYLKQLVSLYGKEEVIKGGMWKIANHKRWIFDEAMEILNKI